jgi:beta-galactosidase
MEMGNEYIRMALWMAHMHGMGVNQTWYWGRGKDLLPKNSDSNGFAGTFAHRPIALNAYGQSMKEINAYGKEIAALNRVNRPVRIFYSEATAINDPDYMNRIYDLYKVLYHKGIYLGFETAQSIGRKSARCVAERSILISAGTANVTPDDRKALNDYLTCGGAVIFAGKENFVRDEYQRKITFSSPVASGRIVQIPEMDADTLWLAVQSQLHSKKLLPDITCDESNATGEPGCMWRVAEFNGERLLFIANLGSSTAEIYVRSKHPDRAKTIDLISNSETALSFRLKPYEIRLMKLYNLKEDPKEEQNLSGSKPEVAGQLLEELVKWRRTNKVPLPPESALKD